MSKVLVLINYWVIYQNWIVEKEVLSTFIYLSSEEELSIIQQEYHRMFKRILIGYLKGDYCVVCFVVI